MKDTFFVEIERSGSLFNTFFLRAPKDPTTFYVFADVTGEQMNEDPPDAPTAIFEFKYAIPNDPGAGFFLKNVEYLEPSKFPFPENVQWENLVMHEISKEQALLYRRSAL